SLTLRVSVERNRRCQGRDAVNPRPWDDPLCSDAFLSLRVTSLRIYWPLTTNHWPLFSCRWPLFSRHSPLSPAVRRDQRGQVVRRSSPTGYCLTPTAALSKTERGPISTNGPLYIQRADKELKAPPALGGSAMVARPTRPQIFAVNSTAPACHDRRAAPARACSSNRIWRTTGYRCGTGPFPQRWRSWPKPPSRRVLCSATAKLLRDE